MAGSLKVHRSIKTNHKYLDTLMITEHVSAKKAIPVQTLRVPECEDLRFLDNQHMKVVMSTLWTGRLYPSDNIPGTHFC